MVDLGFINNRNHLKMPTPCPLLAPPLSRGMWAGTEHPTRLLLPSPEGCGSLRRMHTLPKRPSPLLRDVGRFHSCSEETGDREEEPGGTHGMGGPYGAS